jgi:hypothetical protein
MLIIDIIHNAIKSTNKQFVSVFESENILVYKFDKNTKQLTFYEGLRASKKNGRGVVSFYLRKKERFIFPLKTIPVGDITKFIKDNLK